MLRAQTLPISIGEFGNIPLRYVSEKSFKEKTLGTGDVIIKKSGGSPTQSTGYTIYVSKDLLTEKGTVISINFYFKFPEFHSENRRTNGQVSARGDASTRKPFVWQRFSTRNIK